MSDARLDQLFVGRRRQRRGEDREIFQTLHYASRKGGDADVPVVRTGIPLLEHEKPMIQPLGA